jgi:hypothetical protein
MMHFFDEYEFVRSGVGPAWSGSRHVDQYDRQAVHAEGARKLSRTANCTEWATNDSIVNWELRDTGGNVAGAAFAAHNVDGRKRSLQSTVVSAHVCEL